MSIFSLFRGTNLADGVRRAAECGAALVDVRTPEEVAEGHVPGAVNIPLGTLAAAKLPAGELYVYCHSGARSAQAVRCLKGRGVKAENIGGIAGYTGPVERGI